MLNLIKYFEPIFYPWIVLISSLVSCFYLQCLMAWSDRWSTRLMTSCCHVYPQTDYCWHSSSQRRLATRRPTDWFNIHFYDIQPSFSSSFSAFFMHQDRSQDAKNEEAVQGVWGQFPSWVQGEAPVGGLEEAKLKSFQNSLSWNSLFLYRGTRLTLKHWRLPCSSVPGYRQS